MNTHRCPSDLTDEEWAILGPLVTPGKQVGRPQVLQLRRITDAVFHLLRAGCQWRALPHDFPPWTAVFHHSAKWRRQGTWERINAALRERHRLAIGRQPQPTAASQEAFEAVPRTLDSQSVRAPEAGGPRGHDGGKTVSGRKRHILVDTEGSLLKARVHPADIHDRSGAPLLLHGSAAEFPRIVLVWADTACQGLKPWMAETLGWRLTISKHWWTGRHGVWVAPGQQPPEIPRGFHVLKRRWVVERTFAWIGRNRRMSRDFERLIKTSERLLYAAMARVTLRRSAKRTN
jgi:putative transposase